MRFAAPAAALGLLLAGCASPAQRIERKLVEVGLPQPQARCMGVRLQDRLSTDQLRRLGELAAIDRGRIGRMRVDELVAMLGDRRDPALVSELVRAGIGCAI